VKAVIIENNALRLTQRPDPTPGTGQVVVTTEFAGINAADLLQRSGFYPAPPGWPVDVPGMELSGRVSGVGPGVDESMLGRRVCAIVGSGAQATQCIVPAAHLIGVPECVEMDRAGGFAEAFITAYDALVVQGHVAPHERVLVSGASGGVGCAAVQIGHLLGAHVTAVTRTDAHHDALRSLGADDVITSDHVADIEPVNMVLELVGAAHLAQAQRKLADFARVVVIGVAGGGSRVEVDLLNIMRTRSTLTGSTLRSRSHDEKAALIARVTHDLTEPWASGALSVPIAKTFAFEDVADAYEYFAQSGKFGKVVLDMASSPS
jgi:NADPH:quinone reductase